MLSVELSVSHIGAVGENWYDNFICYAALWCGGSRAFFLLWGCKNDNCKVIPLVPPQIYHSPFVIVLLQYGQGTVVNFSTFPVPTQSWKKVEDASTHTRSFFCVCVCNLFLSTFLELMLSDHIYSYLTDCSSHLLDKP